MRQTRKDLLEVAKRNKVWIHIANEMKEMGFSFNDKQVKNRWHYLVNRFKKMTDEHNTSGNRRKNWEFFDDINAVIAEKPNIKPVYMNETELSDDEDKKTDGDEKKTDDSVNEEGGSELDLKEQKAQKRKYTSPSDKLGKLLEQFWEEKERSEEQKRKEQQEREAQREEKRKKKTKKNKNYSKHF